MTDTTQPQERDTLIERLAQAVDHIGGYGGIRRDPTLLADLLAFLRAQPSPREEKEYWQAWARKRLDITHAAWMHAAKTALAGNLGPLRNRVALAESGPVEKGEPG